MSGSAVQSNTTVLSVTQELKRGSPPLCGTVYLAFYPELVPDVRSE